MAVTGQKQVYSLVASGLTTVNLLQNAYISGFGGICTLIIVVLRAERYNSDDERNQVK